MVPIQMAESSNDIFQGGFVNAFCAGIVPFDIKIKLNT